MTRGDCVSSDTNPTTGMDGLPSANKSSSCIGFGRAACEAVSVRLDPAPCLESPKEYYSVHETSGLYTDKPVGVPAAGPGHLHNTRKHIAVAYNQLAPGF